MTDHDVELELLTPPPQAIPTSNRIRIASINLLYSSDGRYIFQRQAHVVRVLHAPTGRVLHECVRTDKKNVVCALALHPYNALQLLAAYDDGMILVWDFIEHKVLVELNAKDPIRWMASSRTCPSQLLLVTQSDPTTWNLVEFSLKKKKRGRLLLQNNKQKFHAAALQSYVTSQDKQTEPGDFVVLAANKKLVTLWFTHQPGTQDSSTRVYTIQKLTHYCAVSCVAISPTKREFSIGDQIGQIFRHFTQTISREDGAKMHWHSHAVHCIQYSSDGQFLLSGGEECVLVSWHLETGRRAYLPRLPAAVETIAPRPDGGVYAVSLADNVLFQYNPVTREQEWEARGLARAGNSAASSIPTRQLVIDPLTKSLVLNGSSGAGILQFFEPFADRVLQTLLLSERNQVTRTEDEVLPIFRALYSCFSSNGKDLVTLHAPTTAQYGDESALRFWTRRVDGTFFVNTAIDAPHGRARVTSMAYTPSSFYDCVVSGDEKGDFKVWNKTKIEAGGTAWHCQAVVRYRDEPITALAFARDGSLLAVAYGNKLTLWDITTHALRRVIPSADGNTIKQIVFLGTSSPYVVIVTTNQVQVWNLLSLTMLWRYTVPKGTVVAEEVMYERFLVWLPVDKKTVILVFDAQTSVPTCIRVVDLGSKVWSAGFHPPTMDIILIDNKMGVWRLDGPKAKSLNARLRKQAHIAAVAARDATKYGEQDIKMLSAIYKAASNNVAKKKMLDSVKVNGSASSHLFDAPAHVLPSMTALYQSFMDTMLPKSHQAVNSNESQKKKNKRRNKEQEHATIDVQVGGNEVQRKRTKLQVEKELANTELRQQTYSKLLETFRKTKARRV
ncbi:WD40 repeat protein [Plasmopara halstedii]|uniref:WD40 repeat protein n=1 Tax=Plasmopara halstedii TaxID=4781 RepID=A0A0P1B5F9_PLAHL|nr:WD40 repeat protein [Plasmopara halstedii]CEG49669.1 WD40 repeat protein [Plasmopara halstedii]|eukprot:XP_024586038.1 WD40 repeat protein [Plasmopara halstedii]